MIPDLREHSLFMRGGEGMGENLKISNFFSDPPPKYLKQFSDPPPSEVDYNLSLFLKNAKTQLFCLIKYIIHA